MVLATLLSGIAMAVHLALGALVLMRAPRQPVNQCFSFLLFLFFVWSLAELLLINFGTPAISTPPQASSISSNFSSGSAPWLVSLLLTPMIMLPPIFALFTALFPRRLEEAWQLGCPVRQALLFVPAIVLLFLIWSGNLVRSVDPVEGGFLISLGRFEFLAKGIIVAYLLLAMKTLGMARAGLETEFQERRLRYAFAAFVLPAAAGSVFIALGRIYLTGQTMYTFGLFPILGIAMAGILGYAILRYKLLEIDMIFSIGLVYTLLTAILAGVLELLENGLQNQLNLSGSAATVVSTLVIAASFSPLKNMIVAGVDKFFGRRSFDTAAVIRHVLKSMRNADSSDVVLDTLMRELQPVLNFSNAALLLENGACRTWPPASPPVSGPIPTEWPAAEEIDAMLEAGRDNVRIQTDMFRQWREHGFHWAFQICREQAVQGVFLLAPKPGRLPYSDQERSLVASLCQEVPPVLDTLALLEGMVSHDRAARELEWAGRLYAELRNAPEHMEFGIYNAILYSSLAHEIKGDLLFVEQESATPFLAVCDAFHQGIAAAVTLHIVAAALRASPVEGRMDAVHDILRRFSSPPLRTALTLVESCTSGIRLHLAGNPRPYLLGKNQPPSRPGVQGEPLGISQLSAAGTTELDLQAGELLLVATNGLAKAFGSSGEEHLHAFFARHSGSTAGMLHAALQKHLAEIPGASSFPDDISYVIFQRRT